MLSAPLSGLVLTRMVTFLAKLFNILSFNLYFFEETCFCHLHTYLLACFYKIHLKFLISRIYFPLGDCELCKQYLSSSQEIKGQICDLEIVEPEEILINSCVMFYNTLLD